MTTTTIDLSADTILNLTLRAGCGGTIRVTITSGATDISGAAIHYYANTNKTISKTVGNGITITEALVFEIAFTAEDTNEQNTTQKRQHECRIQLSGEQPAMVFEGLLTIEEALTTEMS